MKVTFEIEDADFHGDMMTVTFIGGASSPTINATSSALPLYRTDHTFFVPVKGAIHERKEEES